MNITNLPFPFDTENWGRILYCEEPVRGIFELETTRDGGIYVVDRKRCAIRLPPDAFSYGIRYADDAFAYFDFDNGRYVLQHELILHQLKHCLPTERAALEEELFSIAMFGAKDYSGYFGRLTPQYMTPWGPRTRYIEAEPGVWFVQTGGKWRFSLAWPYYISRIEMLKRTAKGNEGDMGYLTYEDMYWELEDCPPVVHSMLGYTPGLLKLVPSLEALEQRLEREFPKYAYLLKAEFDDSRTIEQLQAGDF